MKKGVHPQLHKDSKTTCMSCGAVYAIPTTVKTQQVEVCSNCHPIYTGEYRGIMTSGRVDRFRKMQETSAKKKEQVEAVEAKRKSKK
jgi:large subunit ribosomal protein L31